MLFWRSLRARLVASHLLLSLGLIVVVGLVFSAIFTNYAIQSHQERMQTAQEQAINMLRESTDPPDVVWERLHVLFPEFEVMVEPPHFIVAPSVSATTTSPQGSPQQIIFTRGPEPSSGELSSFSITYPFGTSPAQFRFTHPTSTRTIVRDISLRMGLVCAVGFVLASVLGIWFSRSLTRPLQRLTAATAAVAGGDLGKRVEPTGLLDLDQFVNQFNHMSAALQESFQALALERDTARQFAADAAHELKTPLTALKAANELALTRPEYLEQTLRSSGRQVERLERVVGALLSMARVSEGKIAAVSPVDVTELIQGALPDWGAQAEHAGHTLEVLDPGEPVLVLANPDVLLLALSNLVDNACKFTRPGGVIAVGLTVTEGESCVEVTDTGPGIPPDELPHIFKRFYRGIDTQRLQGSGLGLAIVQEAITRMGGQVTASSEVGKGSRFMVRLPLIGQEREPE